ncbi:MAG: lipopolysaccharide kinase InaA family protein, partial [Phycisphaerae bacterium]
MTGLIHRWRRPMRPAEPDEARPPRPGPTSGCDAADASVLSVRTERLRWRCDRDYLWLINGPDAPDWMNLSAEPAAELVKRSGPRQVWRLCLGRHELFAKIYRPVTFTDHLRRLLRGSASRNERRVARYALQAGLHAPLPVACGQTNHRWLGRDDILITQAVSSALPLNVRWLQICQLADRWQRYRQGRLLGEALAYSLARAHQSGLQHPDLHAANLLVEPAEEGPPRIVFVDLQAARTGRPVGDRAVIKNLVQLNQWFQRHASRTDRLRFLKQYLLYRQRFASLEHARQLGIAYPAIVARIQRRARRHAARLWAKRDRTAVRDGRYFARISLPGGWRGHVFLQAKKPLPGSRASGLVFTRAQWQRWLANPLQWVDPGCQQLVKGSHTATVCRAYLPV